MLPLWPADVASAWTKSALAMTEAGFSLAIAANQAALAMCSPGSSAGSTGGSTAARQAPAPETSRMPERAAFGPSSPDRVKSWYRAPYRSPFDPMFWLEPNGRNGEAPLWPMTPSAAMELWRAGTAQQPWLAPAAVQQAWWRMMTPSMPGASAAVAQMPTVPAMMPDLAAPFSAYRSMGGYAVAQTIVSQMLEPAGYGKPATTGPSLMQLYFPWLSH